MNKFFKGYNFQIVKRALLGLAMFLTDEALIGTRVYSRGGMKCHEEA